MKKLTLALLVLSIAACKSDSKPASQAPPGTGSGASEQPAPAPSSRLDGTKVTAVRCHITGLGTEHLRSLHADASGTIYVFDDSRQPHKIAAGAGPCELAYAGTIEGSSFAFAADGAVIPAPEDRGA